MSIRSFLSRWYRRVPIIRELCQIASSLEQVRAEIAAEADHIAQAIHAAQANHVARVIQTAQVNRLLDLELERLPRYGDPLRLQRFGFQVCSQNDEDGIIHEISRRIGTTNRVFAEVGIGDGCENNTAFLLSQGWTGFWIDGSDRFLSTIEKRPDLQNGCLKSLVSIVTRENLAPLFAQLGVPIELDLLSLDIDQNTYYAWEGLKNYRPRVIVVEYNASIPPVVEWKAHYDPHRTWDGSHNFGASLKSFEMLGCQLGYSLVGCDLIGVNAFFVRDDLVADKFASPFTAENHYEPPRYALSRRRGHPAAILDRTDGS